MKTLIIKSLLTSLYQIPKAFGTLWQRGVRGDFSNNDILLMYSFVMFIQCANMIQGCHSGLARIFLYDSVQVRRIPDKRE